MFTTVFGAFLLGLFGSAHCVGMCGAFVLGIGGVARRSGREASILVRYFSGKTLTYTLLGAAAGGAGSVATFALGPFQTMLSIVIGVLLIGVGMGLLGLGGRFVIGARFYNRLSSATAAVMKRKRPWSMFGLGALNGLLPCGLVYGGMLLAASTASVFNGMLTMAAFGIATVPALALVGWSTGLLDRIGMRRHLPRIGAVLVIAMGLLTIARATPVVESLHGSHGSVPAETEQPINHHRRAH